MNEVSGRPAPIVDLSAGVSALAPGLLWLHQARAIVAADVHLAYEDVIGAALPAWSTSELVRVLARAAERMGAREIVLLGDIIHGTRMSEGAARAVRQGLERLRAIAQLTLVAGNHEGRSRGAAVLGRTMESVQRDGWRLLHGDEPDLRAPAARSIIGHLHPSLALGHGRTAPAFLFSRSAIVLPALTPYSSGLNVFSAECLQALRSFGVASRSQLGLVAVAGEVLYPFGALSDLRAVIGESGAVGKSRRKWLRPDG